MQEIKLLKELTHKTKAETSKQFYLELQKSVKKLASEQVMSRNVLNSVLALPVLPTLREYKEEVLHQLQTRLIEQEETTEAIASYAEKKIRKGSTVFVHGYDQHVVNTLKKAHDSHKHFVVHNVSSHPEQIGRKMATDLAKIGISVTHFTDTALRAALKKADVMFIGCDALTTDSIIGSLGTELCAEIAERYDVPVYVLASAFKFDREGLHKTLDFPHPKSVWEKPPKHVKVVHHNYERIDPKLIAGVISELGIYPHSQFIDEVVRMHPWMRKPISKRW